MQMRDLQVSLIILTTINFCEFISSGRKHLNLTKLRRIIIQKLHIRSAFHFKLEF